MAKADTSVVPELLEQVQSLPVEKQLRVLAFARSQGRELPRGTAGGDLIHFAGTISLDDLKLMESEIERGCERVPDDAWPSA